MKRLTFITLLLLAACLPCGTTVLADAAPQKVTVEAEGSGASETEALKNAWMEAVRQAVGMFMAGKTEMINDEITEQIATYSRGQVNSYEVLDKQTDGGIWRVRIRANIEQDLLRETASKRGQAAQALVDDNLMAQAVTANEKAGSLVELIKASAHLLDFTECLSPSFEIVLGDDPEKPGNKVFFVRHQLIVDINKYNQRLVELHKFFSMIS